MSSSRHHLRSPPKRRSSLRDGGAMEEIEMQETNSSNKYPSSKIIEPPSMRSGMTGRDPIEDYVPFSPIAGVAPAPGFFASTRPIVVASTPTANGHERIQQSGGSISSKTSLRSNARRSSVRSPRKAYSPVSRAPRSGSRSPRKMAAELGVAVAKEQLRKRQLQEQLELQKQQQKELALLQQKQDEELKRQPLIVKAQADSLEKANNEKSNQRFAKPKEAAAGQASNKKSKQNEAAASKTSMSSIRRTLQREAKLAKRPMADELLERIGDEDSTDNERYHPGHRHSRGASSNEQRSHCTHTDNDGTSTDYLSTTDSCYESFTEAEVLSSMDSSHTDDDMHYNAMVDDVPGSPVKKYKHRLQKWYRNRLPSLSKSASHSTMDSSTIRGASTNETDDYDDFTADPREKISAFAFIGDDPIMSRDKNDNCEQTKKQRVAYCTIGLTSIQLLTLMLQLAMCGIAPLDMNPMIGPFPDAFSLWGGKNPYKMLQEDQWWRMLSPCLLHMGILHWIANAFCQLNAVALFERDWGWFKWTLFYLISTVGCSAFSNYFDQDSVAVGSSGSLMGLYAAKLAQVVTLSLFDSHAGVEIDDIIQLDQLSSVLCGLTLLSVLGSFTYIDWSGNMGGLLSGFLAGVFVFSSSIDGCCWSFLWFLLGFAGTVASIGYVMYLYVEEADPDEELADVCNYFRSLWPENYECGCMW